MQTSFDSYLIGALIGWADSNGTKCHIVVNADYISDSVIKPLVDSKTGNIVFNVCAQATSNTLIMGDNELQFNARFNGRATVVKVPYNKILQAFIPGADDAPILLRSPDGNRMLMAYMEEIKTTMSADEPMDQLSTKSKPPALKVVDNKPETTSNVVPLKPKS